MKKNKGKRARKTKKKIWPKVLIIILLIVAIAVGAFIYKSQKNGGGLQGMLATVMGHDEETKKNLPEFKALILGISTDLDSKLTDTIMVASYNPNTQKGTILSIPRDTYIGKNKNKATGNDKLNAEYANKNGPEGTLAAVNEITGLDIKYYVVVETEALIKLVDAIGGVQFNVPIQMKYDDPTQNLHINLEAGEQKIDGAKAEQLLRFRHNNNGTSYSTEYGDNDIGRMRTQREFIAETMRQTLKIENIFKLGQILDIAKEYVETNIDFNSAKDYIPYLVEFKTENLTSDTLPGTPIKYNELWFYEYDKEESKELIKKLFYERDYGEKQEDTEENSNTEKQKNKIKIEVVNGTGATEKYEEAVQKLKDAGYTVSTPKKSNKTTSSRTVITNQKYAESDVIEEIKTILGTGDVSNNASSTSTTDITILIGTDYK